MQAGVSGIRAEGEALSVVGDNIANVNTVGFKRERANFEDLLGHSVLAGSGSALPGSGAQVGATQQLFTQGALSNTGVTTDLALNGDGFFVVKGSVEGIESNFFTRAGQFVIDRDGYMTNPSGLKLQGYAADLTDGTFAAEPSSIQVPTSVIPAKRTTEVQLVANFDFNSPVTGGPNAAWNLADPGSGSSFSTAVTVYDSLGSPHSLDLFFRKNDDSTWGYLVQTEGNSVAAGVFHFTTTGALDRHDQQVIEVDFPGADPGQQILLNVGQSIDAGGTGLEGVTQFAAASNISNQSQDGYAAGEFSGISIDDQGIVSGLYTNGEKLAISQLAVAQFRSNDGLGRAGQNLWIDTRDSGTAALGTAGVGGRGAVSAGALEAANVDLAEEFVGLIQHQRAFSANSKTVTTADEMLQELINIKR
jgi:flagellar hook protein FlgE